MTIQEIITTRNIESILHFTTSDGLLGMLADPKPQLRPRSQLAATNHLEYILKYNCPKRTDTDWIDYSSLSISEVNCYFFNYSFGRHPGEFWAVLEFSVKILTHEGVYFATTNNIYPDVERGQGAAGLEALFAPRIKNGKLREGWLHRHPNRPRHCPTDKQAEVLYPGSLSFAYLKQIFVPDNDSLCLIQGQLQALSCEYEVKIAPEYFKQ